MIRNHKLRTAVIAFLFLGTIGYAGESYAKDTKINQSLPIYIKHRNSLVESAVTKLGNKDNGEAEITYYRSHHILRFQVTDFNFRDKFKGKALDEQVQYFQRLSHLRYINVQIQMTKSAIHSHHIQLHEQAQQRAENHAEVVREEKQAERKAKAQAKKIKQQKLAKAKAKAKRKAEQQKRQKQAQQRKEAQQKNAKIRQEKSHSQKANQKNKNQRH